MNQDFEGEFSVLENQIYLRYRTKKESVSVLLHVKNSLRIGKRIVVTDYELIRVDYENRNTHYRVLVVNRSHHQVIDWHRHMCKESGALVYRKNYTLLGDFNSHLDWKIKQALKKGKPHLELVNGNFHTQWVEESTRGENFLHLVYTTLDDIH